MTTKQDIQEWFERGLEDENNTHMIVVCDTYDYEDYPTFVNKEQDIHQRIDYYSGNMQKVMEVYNLKLDMESQLNKTKCWSL